MNAAKPQGRKIKLHKWAPKFKRGENFSMVVIASRNSGKSYLMRHLIRDYLKDKFDLFVIVSDSPDTKQDFQPCCPDGTIFLTDMNYSIINNLMEANAKRQKEGKIPLNMLLLYDDKIGNDVKNDQQLLNIFTRGRHIGVSVIFSSQSKKLAETTWLNNSDYTVILKSNSAQQKKSVLENILRGSIYIEDPKEEVEILRQIVRNYCSAQGDALVINAREKSDDNLFWYRAP